MKLEEYEMKSGKSTKNSLKSFLKEDNLISRPHFQSRVVKRLKNPGDWSENVYKDTRKK